MATPKRIAWDACTWIATIILEQAALPDGGVEDRGAMCLPIIALAKTGQLEIATSGLSLVEVCKHNSVKGEDNDVLADFFRHDYILVVPVDRHVGTLARELMTAGYAGLKPADAVHLATAIVSQASEFHTFDAKLLKLDQKLDRLDGGLLRICKPLPPAPPPKPLAPAPLFDAPAP